VAVAGVVFVVSHDRGTSKVHCPGGTGTPRHQEDGGQNLRLREHNPSVLQLR
jgi:hypothetical protein